LLEWRGREERRKTLMFESQLDKIIAERYDTGRYWSVPGYIVIFAMKV